MSGWALFPFNERERRVQRDGWRRKEQQQQQQKKKEERERLVVRLIAFFGVCVKTNRKWIEIRIC